MNRDQKHELKLHLIYSYIGVMLLLAAGAVLGSGIIGFGIAVFWVTHSFYAAIGMCVLADALLAGTIVWLTHTW